MSQRTLLQALQDETPPWQSEAPCRGSSQFFPPDTNFERRGERETRERKAKRVCAGCHVRQECLDYALSKGEPYGIWGGLDEHERRRIRTRQELERSQEREA